MYVFGVFILDGLKGQKEEVECFGIPPEKLVYVETLESSPLIICNFLQPHDVTLTVGLPEAADGGVHICYVLENLVRRSGDTTVHEPSIYSRHVNTKQRQVFGE